MRTALPLLIVAFAIMGFADSRSAMFVAMGMLGLGMGLAGPGFMALRQAIDLGAAFFVPLLAFTWRVKLRRDDDLEAPGTDD